MGDIIGNGYLALRREDGTLIGDGDYNRAIGEYNKANGTNYGWTKPAEGETNLTASGAKVRDADVVSKCRTVHFGIGKEYNKRFRINRSRPRAC